MILPAWQQWAAAGALGLAVGWTVNGWRLDGEAATLRAAAEHERAESFRLVLAEQDRAAAAVHAADVAATGRITDVEKEADRLERCIAAGTGCGLRVKVTRAACVPAPGAPAGVGDRGSEWAELDATARQDYRALRAGLVRLEQALAVCVAPRLAQ